jgi:hypothetical protein
MRTFVQHLLMHIFSIYSYYFHIYIGPGWRMFKQRENNSITPHNFFSDLIKVFSSEVFSNALLKKFHASTIM